MISNEPANLSAIAIEDMEVCFIPKEEIVRDLKSNTNFTMSILKEMAVSLKEADNVIVDMAQKTVKQRLAETLLHLNKTYGSENLEKPLDIQLSREDIASIIGTATESAIRLLSSFKKEKYIHLKGKEIYKILFASFLMVLIDLLMEKSAPKLDFWEFVISPVPFSNYLWWFIFSLCFQYIFFKTVKTKEYNLSSNILVIQFIFFGMLAVFL